ncbi:MAG: hypothetical protein CMJ06_06005 [Pelagibacterales bacterium]|nr:hypothetical protein [Pelagibacterales bacterium]OUU61188.1 MAG: hypothetical protein CBC22_08150 [Alphaproteobacteria bacterium TMED62]|tara:strand:+ start:4123 stop:4395 length:273 start_codon:yes stop_codon:yes gene_type:complete
MNNIYIIFIINKFNYLNKYEYLLLILLGVFFLSLFVSFTLNLKSKKNINHIKDNLLKKEKLLIRLKESYENGQINANEYKHRIINLTKDI